MANGVAHQFVGAAAGIATCIQDDGIKKPELYNPVTAAMAGGFFATLPDRLEPALHPNHRQFFHSVAILALIATGVRAAYRWEPATKGQALLRALLLVGGVAYGTHLVLDGLTPKSIPLIGKA